MGELTKEVLLQKRKESHEEDYQITFPGYEGTVKIRPIQSVEEFQFILKESERFFNVSKTMGINLGEGWLIAPDKAAILCATIVAACMVKPDMTLLEVLAMQENTGMTVSRMADQIAVISGLGGGGAEGKDKMEEELRSDSFLSDDLRIKFGIPTSSSIRNESKFKIVDGDSGLQPDQGSRNEQEDKESKAKLEEFLLG